MPSPPIISVDGFWGPHEWTVYPQPYRRAFPYLAWIALSSPSPSVSSDVVSRPVEKTMWQAHPSKSDTHVINPDLLDELEVKWRSTKAALEASLRAFSAVPSLSSVEQPMKAYARGFEALERLKVEFRAWRDFVEVFRNLQRSLLELCAFLAWWSEVCASDAHRPPIRGPTRGAIFQDEQMYANHARWSVAAYLLIPESTFALDPRKKVPLSPRNLCKTQPMSYFRLVHSLPQWCYPPLVRDVMIDLETTARGYAERLDDFRPTKMLKRKLDKVENRANDEGEYIFRLSLIQTNDLCTAGRRAQKARTSSALPVTQSSNLELRRFAGAGSAPPWFPKIQEVWADAMNHVCHLDLASTTSPRRFALPPTHLFWGGSEKSQQTFYHHFLLLHHKIKDRCTCDVKGLTTKEWRSILNDAYWKLQWPKLDNPSQGSTFDSNVFWKYGGPLFFGKERSEDVAAERHDPKSIIATSR